MVQIYAINSKFLDNSSIFNKYYSMATDYRKKKISNLKQIDDKINSLAAEILLNYSLKKRWNLCINDILLKYNEFGKPYISNMEEIYFNLSHSKNYVVCAIDNTSVGVDIEYIRDINLNIVKRFFKNKYDDISILEKNNQNTEVMRLWTQKESYGKYTGEGFYSKTESSCYFKQYDTIEGYIITVCATNNNFFDEIIVYEPVDL